MPTARETHEKSLETKAVLLDAIQAEVAEVLEYEHIEARTSGLESLSRAYRLVEGGPQSSISASL